MSNISRQENASYWRFQIIWWVLYYAIGLVINILNGEHVGSAVILHILLFVVSVGLSHLFRGEIERQRLNRPLSRMWPLFASGVAGISLLLTALIVGLSSTVFRVSGEAWSVAAMGALAWGMFLGTGIWTMLYVRFTEVRRQHEREINLRLAVREAELRALEAQINPHFLFNCLNSIRALVAENPARAQDMITRQANIFRYNLRRDHAHTVPLASEVEVVGDYLALESVRFEDRLRVRFAIAPGTEKTAVPSMLLQSLVENALKHGIAPRPAGGDLIIRAEPVIRADRESNATRIEVENTGELTQAAASEPAGLGLNNTRERLRLLYDGRASLELRNREDGHVVATVLIPAQA